MLIIVYFQIRVNYCIFVVKVIWVCFDLNLGKVKKIYFLFWFKRVFAHWKVTF